MRVNGRPVVAEVLHDSAGGDLSAPLVVVPGMGAAEDFAAVDVQGAVALVERGLVFFREKVANAAAAGAIGVLIYNNEPGAFSGTLGETSAIPAVSISQAQGQALRTQATKAAQAAQAAQAGDTTDAPVTPVTVEIQIRYDPLSGESQNVVARRTDGGPAGSGWGATTTRCPAWPARTTTPAARRWSWSWRGPTPTAPAAG